MLTRRNFLHGAAAAGACAPLAGTALGEDPAAPTSPWPIHLNSSTIRPASLKEKIRIAAEAGYDGIELWIDDLEKHEKEGGDLKALGREIRDRGLVVHNIIGLWDCMPEGRAARDESLPATRERMRRSADVGSKHVAAIPLPDREDFDLGWATECYRNLLAVGKEDYGIVPAFEFVGFFKGIHRFGQAAAVALDTGDPDACLVMDTFHLWRGGSGFNNIHLVNGKLIANFHVNDVPADLERTGAKDKDRIFPGDGRLPLVRLLKDLRKIGYAGPLSIETFRREHWNSNPKEVAEEGIRKLRAVVREALS